MILGQRVARRLVLKVIHRGPYEKILEKNKRSIKERKYKTSRTLKILGEAESMVGKLEDGKKKYLNSFKTILYIRVLRCRRTL